VKAARRLRLRRESLGELSAGELERIVGGTHVGCNGVTDACTHGACATETVKPVHSCIGPCYTEPQYTCFC
jgi:hypothetical protein